MAEYGELLSSRDMPSTVRPDLKLPLSMNPEMETVYALRDETICITTPLMAANWCAAPIVYAIQYSFVIFRLMMLHPRFCKSIVLTIKKV